MSIRLFHLFLFCLLVNGLTAQFNQTQTFDVTSGLPMTECNAIHCDKEGRIWTVHNNGVITCYDGLSFTAYPSELTRHFTAGALFFEDMTGIWILSTEHSISLYAKGKWNHWNSPIFAIADIDKATNQIVGLDRAGNLFHFDTTRMDWVIHSKAPDLIPNSIYFLTSSLDENKYLLQIFRSDTSRVPLQAFSSTSLMSPVWQPAPELMHAAFFCNHGVIDAFEKKGKIHQYEYQSTNFIIPIPSDDISFYQIFKSANNMLMYHSKPLPAGSNREVTVYISDHDSNFYPIARFYNPHRTLNFTLDKSGHLWVSSQGGLMRIDPAILQCHEGHPNMVASLNVINEDELGRIWFGGYSDGLCYFDGYNVHPSPSNASHFKRFLPGGYRDQSGHMAFWTEDYSLVIYSSGQWSQQHSNFNQAHTSLGYYFFNLDQQHIAAGLMNHGIGITQLPLKYNSIWNFISKEKGMLLDNVLTISSDAKDRLWVGRPTQGVAVYDMQSDTARTWLRQSDSDFNYGMVSSITDHDGRLWMGCSDGLRVVTSPSTFQMFAEDLNSVAHKIDMAEAGNTQVEFLKELKNYIVFGNFEGYGFIDLKSMEITPEKPRIFFYPTKEFGGAAKQNAVYADTKGFLWFGEDKGATRIDLSKFNFDTLPVHIIIDSLMAGADKIELQQDLNTLNITSSKKLPTLKRYVEIFLHPSFTGLLNDNVGFQYRMLHDKVQDTTWSHYAKTNKITFSYMPPGKNSIEIRAIKNNQVADVATLDLYIPFALSESPWFWISSIAGLSIIGAILSFLFYRQQLRMKEYQINLSEQRREKEQFQIRAIASSLNPHFIKNSLNWAQTRFRSDPKVVTVINELSSNISTIFNRSREGQAFHSLKDEFELVKNYISIQQATYGQFLDISFPAPATIEQYKNIFVPLMQIQIHVENAIEHGIRNRTGAHLLDIALEDEKDYVHLTITDDGIGRKGAIELGSHGTQQGTMMLKSLHDIFNQYNTYKFSSTYEDLPLTDPVTGLKVGTRVHILIPKHFEYQNHENNTIFHS